MPESEAGRPLQNLGLAENTVPASFAQGTVKAVGTYLAKIRIHLIRLLPTSCANQIEVEPMPGESLEIVLVVVGQKMRADPSATAGTYVTATEPHSVRMLVAFLIHATAPACVFF
jgi:hypothetical protein